MTLDWIPETRDAWREFDIGDPDIAIRHLDVLEDLSTVSVIVPEADPKNPARTNAAWGRELTETLQGVGINAKRIDWVGGHNAFETERFLALLDDVVSGLVLSLADCNGDDVVDPADLSCVATIEGRDAVLKTLNTLPGDFDGNGDVSFADFLVVSSNFEKDLPRYADGNIDLKGGIEFADFLILSTNFGKTPSDVVAVPEPSSLALMLLCLTVVGTYFSTKGRRESFT